MTKGRFKEFQREIGCPIGYVVDVEVKDMMCIVRDPKK
jgi:hypothetical protein